MTYAHSCTYELVYPLTHRLSFNYMCKHFSNLYVYQSAIDQSSVIMYLVFLGDSDSKESACNAGDSRHGFNPWVRKIPLEEEMATHSSILIWRVPLTEEPHRLQFMGSQSQTQLNNFHYNVFSSPVGILVIDFYQIRF